MTKPSIQQIIETEQQMLLEMNWESIKGQRNVWYNSPNDENEWNIEFTPPLPSKYLISIDLANKEYQPTTFIVNQPL